jgi:hypothetical protein
MRVSFAVVWTPIILCACSNPPKQPAPVTPLSAHIIASDGTPVVGAPEPEVVQLVKIENTGNQKHVIVGNVAGDYEIICNLDANKSEESAIQSCLSPPPQKNYLLFRENTKWQIKGAKEPISLAFFQNWSVSYPKGENVGLLPANTNEAPNQFGVYWLLSWTAKSPAH